MKKTDKTKKPTGVKKAEPHVVELPKPTIINPVAKQTLEELFKTARTFGLVAVSETRREPYNEPKQKGFYVRISMFEEDGIELSVKSDYCAPTIQAGLRDCIAKAKKAKQQTWEHGNK